MAYYEILVGNGTAWLDRYIMETDRPTTDYGALTDCLIDYLVSIGSNSILSMDEYEWDSDLETLHPIDDPDWIIYPDEFVQGGNAGDVLYHGGNFDIREIDESDIEDDDIIIECY